MPKQFQLGADVFEVGELSAMQSFTLQPRIIPALTEALSVVGPQFMDLIVKAKAQIETAHEAGESARGMLADLDIGSLEVDKLALALGGFFAKLPPDELEAVVRSLLGATVLLRGTERVPLFSPQGNPFEAIMRGRTLDTWRLLWHSTRLNYADFFVALGAKGDAQAAVPVASVG